MGSLEATPVPNGSERSIVRLLRRKTPFTCNVCGQKNRIPKTQFGRETPSCSRCGSTVRMRAMVHTLSTELFGESLPATRFPKRKDVKGIGMSDWTGYAGVLAERLDYVNTFYHTEPRLDICDPDPDWFGTLDFILSSDVFEHVAPPVDIAFENAAKLLRPNGIFVFSVPYKLEGNTDEHFPDLFDYRVEKSDADFVLYNRTRAGEEQTFRELVFHGGAGATLEMRVFSKDDLFGHFARAGFSPPRIYSEDFREHGVVWDCQWSLPMAARRGAS